MQYFARVKAFTLEVSLDRCRTPVEQALVVACAADGGSVPSGDYRVMLRVFECMCEIVEFFASACGERGFVEVEQGVRRKGKPLWGRVWASLSNRRWP